MVCQGEPVVSGNIYKYLRTMDQNTIFGSYYGRLEWDVTDMIVDGQDTVLTSQPSDAASFNSLKDVVTLLVFEKE
jgi:hypothetical protein